MMMILRNSSRIVSSRRITPLATKILTTTTTTTTKTTNHFFSSSAPENNNNSNIDRDVDTPPAPVDVIQGPSLLRTPAARPHPSLLFLPGLRSLPFWTSDSPKNSTQPRRIAYNDPMVTKVVEYLESNVDTIREEYMRVAPTMNSDYDGLQDHNNKDNSKLHEGQWDWYTYLSKGNIQGHFVLKFPETSRIINEGLRQSNNNHQLFEGTPFGFSFFSSLGPDAKIAPHNAPTNLRLRIHLPIVVSSSKKEDGDDNDNDNDDINVKTGLPYCGIRVANSIRSYQTNKALVLDDAYDHEVWNDTNETRVVLLVDIWHPDISQTEKEAIVGMFQTAKQNGLWRR